MKGLRKLILIALSAALGFVTVLATSQPAFAAYSFNRTAARDYAYADSADGLVVRNGSYNSYSGNDCANFASQALFAGNQRKVPAIWDFTSKTNFTTSWINVDALSYTMQAPQKLHRAVYYQTTENGGYTSASLGDIYMYSTDGGASFTHMTVSTGWGSFPTHSDPYKTSMTYSSVTGGSGDWMNGHTREREKAPWDIGYWEATAVDRPNYMTIILHFYDSYAY